MTIRASNALNSADVLAIPQSSKHMKGVAWRTAEPVLNENPDQERLFLLFPMTKDPEILIPAWDKAFTEIGKTPGRRKVRRIPYPRRPDGLQHLHLSTE